MRVESHGNLTVELIRHERFGDGRFDPCQAHHGDACPHGHSRFNPNPLNPSCNRLDRVELSPEALGSDGWALNSNRADAPDAMAAISSERDALATPPKLDAPPQDLAPVLGSPALAGLGVALIVPGSLLDVVA